MAVSPNLVSGLTVASTNGPVLDVVQRVQLLAVFDLDVGKSGAAVWAPVNDPVAAIDITGIM